MEKRLAGFPPLVFAGEARRRAEGRANRRANSVKTQAAGFFKGLANTVLGLRSVNPGLLNLFRLNRASRWQVLLRNCSAKPYTGYIPSWH